MQEDRRRDDPRIEEIHNDVKEIRNILMGEQGICVRISVCERSNEATQKELTDHKELHKEYKENKFRITDIFLAIGMLIIGIAEWFKK